MLLTVLLLVAVGYSASKVFAVKVSTDAESKYAYTMSAVANYQVFLVPNELYPAGVMEEGLVYSNKLINGIMIDFSADLAGSLPAQISGNYDISVLVEGYQGASDNRSVIYERRFPLVENASAVSKEKSAVITDSIWLNPDVYRDFADRAEILLGAKPNRQMTVEFSGNFIADTDYGQIKEPFSYAITIPIASSELFSITKPRPVSKTDSIAETKQVQQIDASPFSVLLVVLGGIAFLLALLVLLFGVRPPTAAEQYRLLFKDIQRKYGSRMVRLSMLPPLPENEVVWVADMEGLVKIADETRRPVCYALEPDGLPSEGLFYVLVASKYYLMRLIVTPAPRTNGEDNEVLL